MERLAFAGDGKVRRLSKIVDAVTEMAVADVASGGELYDDLRVQPVLAAYHAYAFGKDTEATT